MVVIFVEPGGGDARVELNVPAEVKTIGDVVEIRQNLWLFGILTTPLPLLQQVLIE